MVPFPNQIINDLKLFLTPLFASFFCCFAPTLPPQNDFATTNEKPVRIWKLMARLRSNFQPHGNQTNTSFRVWTMMSHTKGRRSGKVCRRRRRRRRSEGERSNKGWRWINIVIGMKNPSREATKVITRLRSTTVSNFSFLFHPSIN